MPSHKHQAHCSLCRKLKDCVKFPASKILFAYKHHIPIYQYQDKSPSICKPCYAYLCPDRVFERWDPLGPSDLEFKLYVPNKTVS